MNIGIGEVKHCDVIEHRLFYTVMRSPETVPPDGPEFAEEQVDEAMSWHDKGEHVRKKPHLAVHDDVQSWPEQAETHRLRPKAQQSAVLSKRDGWSTSASTLTRSMSTTSSLAAARVTNKNKYWNNILITLTKSEYN